MWVLSVILNFQDKKKLPNIPIVQIVPEPDVQNDSFSHVLESYDFLKTAESNRRPVVGMFSAGFQFELLTFEIFLPSDRVSVDKNHPVLF